MKKTRASPAKPQIIQAGHAGAQHAGVDPDPVVPEKKKRGRKKNIPSAEPVSPSPAETVSPSPAEPVSPSPAETVSPGEALLVEVDAPKKKRANKKQQAPPVETQPLLEEPAVVVTTHKKRGRKPKGGKVIQQLVHENVLIQDVPNIILHLKCSVSDIPDLNATLTETSTIKPGDVISFNSLETKGADLNDSYQSPDTNCSVESGSGSSRLKPKSTPTPDALIATNSYNHLNDEEEDAGNDIAYSSNDNNLKDIWKKLNHLKLCFHKSDVFQNIGAGTRRSCCFWDTCEFDTPPIYIPKCISPNGGYNVYGCFCSPECALAYLMNEGVDTSVKFERCQMLNAMYGKLLNYEKSIKPAPNPQYILNKFYGNLSIQEYRKLFKSEQIVYVVNKPLTHILPEMYEDNNDFLLNNKVIPNNNYKLKKKTSVFG